MSTVTPRRVPRWAPRVFGLAAVALVAATAWAWRAELTRALVGRSRESQSALAKGQSYLRSGRPDLALQAVSRLGPGEMDEPEALTIRGLALAALNQVEASRHALERSWRLRPDQPMAAKVLAAIYLSSSETGRGLKMLQAAARLDPADFRPWYAMGDTYLRDDRPEEASKAFEEALRRLPDHDESRLGLTDALLRLGRAEEAATWLDSLLKEHPHDPKVLTLAALQARATGRAEDAGRDVDRALELDPDHREALLLRARLRHVGGNPGLALPDAERAVALDPNDPESLNLLATIASALGQEERASEALARRKEALGRLDRMRELTREIETRPDDPEPHWRLGRLAMESGIRNLAVGSFRAALALDPDCPPALQGLRDLGEPIAPGLGPEARSGLESSGLSGSAR